MKNRNTRGELDELLVEFTDSLVGEKGETVEIDDLPMEVDHSISLFDTVRAMSSVLQPGTPSEEFESRLCQAVQERYQKRMVMEKIQRIIGIAVTDEKFRRSFFRDMAAACRSMGIDLTPKELGILQDLKEDALDKFAKSLGEEILDTI